MATTIELMLMVLSAGCVISHATESTPPGPLELKLERLQLQHQEMTQTLNRLLAGQEQIKTILTTGPQEGKIARYFSPVVVMIFCMCLGKGLSVWVCCKTLSLKLRKDRSYTFDTAPLTEKPHCRNAQVRHALSRYFSFTCTPTHLSVNGMNRKCLCFASRICSELIV